MLPVVLAVAGLGFLATIAGVLRRKPQGQVISYDTEASMPAGSTLTIPPQLWPLASAQEAPVIMASVIKWAKVRGLPPQELVATIQVESRGNPKAWANLATEDSRGLMQVNVRTWANTLKKYGMVVEDLWDIDKNIMVGSDIYANYRKKVQSLIVQSGKPQAAPIDVLTRLYYKGPAYVQKKILAGEDASRPYKNAEAAVNNWQIAMNLATRVTSA